MAFRFKEETQSRRDFLKWWWWRALIGIPLFWAMLVVAWTVTFLIGGGFGADNWEVIARFFKTTFSDNIFYPFARYIDWVVAMIAREPRHTTWQSFFAWRFMLVPTGLILWYEFRTLAENPYQFTPQVQGEGRQANLKDLNSFGLTKGKFLYLGSYRGSHTLKLPDTRSVFCIGAPGCGKTAGCVIPAVLEGDNSCMIINDPKGEIYKATSGYRAKLGPVFKMNWAGLDDKEKGVFWPSWNPIGGENLPPLHAGREGYIDTLIYFLIPEGPTGTDPYWVRAGRGCLTGLTGYLCGKVEQARANDYFLMRLEKGELDDADYAVLLSYYNAMRDFPEVAQAIKDAQNKNITGANYLPIGKWGIIPEAWRGQDASFAMLLDVVNNTQVILNKKLKERKDAGDTSVMNTDAWKEMLDDLVLEIAYYGYGRRTLLELSQVQGLPDKQRASVISMALSGINIFKNSAVRARTSLNDLSYNQLRGIKDEKTGQYKPVTIYLSVPLSDLNSSMQISTLFINMTSGYLMEFGPNQMGGPFPMSFMLDEFQHMPSLQSIADGVVFGRTKQNMFYVSVQDWNQISSKYGEEKMNIIISSVAAKVVKRQNNPETRNLMLKGIEPLTKTVHSYDQTEHMFKFNWTKKHKVKYISDTVIGGSGVLKYADNKGLLLYAGHLNRPVEIETPLYFKDGGYKKKASMPEAPNMPAELAKAHAEEGSGVVDNMLITW